MNVLIAGSRNWSNVRTIQQYVDQLPDTVNIITGGAQGADWIAHEIATRRGLATEVYEADWNKHGRGQ